MFRFLTEKFNCLGGSLRDESIAQLNMTCGRSEAAYKLTRLEEFKRIYHESYRIRQILIQTKATNYDVIDKFTDAVDELTTSMASLEKQLCIVETIRAFDEEGLLRNSRIEANCSDEVKEHLKNHEQERLIKADKDDLALLSSIKMALLLLEPQKSMIINSENKLVYDDLSLGYICGLSAGVCRVNFLHKNDKKQMQIQYILQNIFGEENYLFIMSMVNRLSDSNNKAYFNGLKIGANDLLTSQNANYLLPPMGWANHVLQFKELPT